MPIVRRAWVRPHHPAAGFTALAAIGVTREDPSGVDTTTAPVGCCRRSSEHWLEVAD